MGLTLLFTKSRKNGRWLCVMCIISFLVVMAVLLGVYLLVVHFKFKHEVLAIYDRDPAASNIVEVAFCYSGLHAVVIYRMANYLLKMKFPLLPRVLSQLGRFLTGIEIHPGAQIGRGLFIDHGMGVVVGETTIIGDNVTLFQGVTLGGTGKEKGKRHPTIGSNVVIGAGAKVLGNVNIGDGVNIGANAVVIKDVPNNATVVGVPGRIVRHEGKKVGISLDHAALPDPIFELLVKLQDEVHKIEDEIEKKKE